jgi:predicted regulator of Ras-like GTPase activity (Roadblock/LC7/MglB family)
MPGTSATSTTATAESSGLTAALATLRDVAGVNGSFVFRGDGQLLAREIHAMFDDEALAETSQRLARLRETFAAVGDDLDLVVIRFQDHKLYLKVLTDGVLCILADAGVNMPALRMAANVVGRRIAPDLARAAMVPAPSAVPFGSASPTAGSASGAQAPAAASTPVVAHRPAPAGMRRFRGRTLE